jgi:hypothetical protein
MEYKREEDLEVIKDLELRLEIAKGEVKTYRNLLKQQKGLMEVREELGWYDNEK